MISLNQQLLDELELLRDVHTAARQIEDGRGVPHEEARRQALARLSESLAAEGV